LSNDACYGELSESLLNQGVKKSLCRYFQSKSYGTFFKDITSTNSVLTAPFDFGETGYVFI